MQTIYLPVATLEDIDGAVTRQFAFSLVMEFGGEIEAVDYFAKRWDYYTNAYAEAGYKLRSLAVKRFVESPSDLLTSVGRG